MVEAAARAPLAAASVVEAAVWMPAEGVAAEAAKVEAPLPACTARACDRNLRPERQAERKAALDHPEDPLGKPSALASDPAVPEAPTGQPVRPQRSPATRQLAQRCAAPRRR